MASLHWKTHPISNNQTFTAIVSKCFLLLSSLRIEIPRCHDNKSIEIATVVIMVSAHSCNCIQQYSVFFYNYLVRRILNFSCRYCCFFLLSPGCKNMVICFSFNQNWQTVPTCCFVQLKPKKYLQRFTLSSGCRGKRSSHEYIAGLEAAAAVGQQCGPFRMAWATAGISCLRTFMWSFMPCQKTAHLLCLC